MYVFVLPSTVSSQFYLYFMFIKFYYKLALRRPLGVGTTFTSFPPRRGYTRLFIGRAHFPTPVMRPVLITVVRYIEKINRIFPCIKVVANQ